MLAPLSALLVASASALPLPPDNARPLCTPFDSPAGRWVLDASNPGDGERATWVTVQEEAWASGNTTDGPPCRWLVPDAPAFEACMAGRTVVVAGDSVQRYAWIYAALKIFECEAPGAPDPWSPNATKACPYLLSMMQAKSDGWTRTPRNMTLPYRYLRFSHEFFDHVDGVRGDFFGTPGAAHAIVLGGFGYWDARYNMNDVLANVFARFPDDFRERLLSRNPALARRLVVMSTSYAENYDNRLAMFPVAALDAANAEASRAWRAAGVTWFDTRKYTRVTDDAQRRARDAAGGKLLTMDGYHPTRRVQEAIAREWMSWACALPDVAEDGVRDEGRGGGGGGATARPRGARLKRLKLSSDAAATVASGADLPALTLVLLFATALGCARGSLRHKVGTKKAALKASHAQCPSCGAAPASMTAKFCSECGVRIAITKL